MTIVKVYSTSTCPWCVKTKEFLKNHDVKFDDINIENNESARNEMFEKTGQFGVPVIEVGDQVIVGFNKDALKKALKIKD